MSRPAYESELRGADTVALVTLEWGGLTYRFSDVPVDILDADGVSLPYDGGMEGIEISETLAALSGDPEYQAIPIEVIFPDDVAARIQQGHDLGSATAEVALHVVGQTFENREVIVAGIVVEPVYGDEGEPVSFSVEALGEQDAGLTHKATEVASDDTWSDAEPGIPYYPWVFGRPGHWVETDGTTNTVVGSSAIAVEETAGNVDTLVINREPSRATSITINDGSTIEAFATVSDRLDTLGQLVSVVDISGAGTITRAAGTTYHALWTDSAGASYTEDRQGLLEGAGDVALAILERSSLKIDRRRWVALGEALNVYKIAGYIDDAIRPWDWLVEFLLPILPISMAAGTAGIYPFLWPLRPTARDAIATLTEGDGCTSDGPIRYVRHPRDAYDEIRLTYARGAGPGDDQLYGGRIHMGFDPVIDDSRNGFSNHAIPTLQGKIAGLRAADSSLRKAPRPARILELTAPIVYDRPTAMRVAGEQLYLASATVREAVYKCSPALRWLRRGDIVKLTHSARSLSDQIAIITGRAILPSLETRITLQIWAQPTRDILTLS